MELPTNFWTIPALARTTMTTKQLRGVLLQHDGRILACGRSWNIVSTKIGPGIYEVRLEERE